MAKLQIKPFLAGLFLVVALTAPSFGQSPAGRPPASSNKAASEKRAPSLAELELLARAEERADAMSSRLLELQMREADLQGRLEDLDYQLTPESIQQALLFIASVRPLDELRDALRARIENEKNRLSRQLELLASSRERLEGAIEDAEAEVGRLRQRLNLQ